MTHSSLRQEQANTLFRCSAALTAAALAISACSSFQPQEPEPEPRDRFFGSTTDGAADYQSFTSYFNQITPANAGKWGSVEAVRDVMNWKDLDEAYDFAKRHRLPFKLHTLVWGQQEPPWLATLPQSEQLEELEEWMALLAKRYPAVAMIDVVNEPLHAPPSYREALGGAGSSGWDWVVTAFEMARRHFPRAELILNEYQVIIWDQFTDEFLRVVAPLRERGVIDAIGEQGHFLERAELAVVRRNLERLAETGLPVYISEFDVSFADDARHANCVRDLFTAFWENPAVRGVTHWGYRQGATWRPNAHLLRSDGSTRPALDWLMCTVRERDDCTVPPYVPKPWEGDARSLTLQAEEYDEAQGVLALGDVVAYTDTGDWLGYQDVVFQPTWDVFRVTYAKGNTTPASVSVHLDTLETEPVLTAALQPTGGWGTLSAVDLPWPSLEGKRNLYVRFSGTDGVANVDSIRFGTPSNLVDNGTFEAGISGWFGWGGTLSSSSERAHSGERSLRVSDRTAGAGTAAYNLTASVTPGSPYSVSFWLAIDGADEAPANLTAKIACAGSSDAYSWLANSSAIPRDTWVELSGTLQVPDCQLNELLIFAEGPPAGVDLYVDDVSVVP
ncbi:MAG TPA: endo-1,4-beta-xylanase [Polyangiaceae bacterium]